MLHTLTDRNDTTHLLGVGIGITGHYTASTTSLTATDNVFANFDLSVIKQTCPWPLVAENNVDCMALARYLYDADDTPARFLFLHSGPGMYSAYIDPGTLHPKRNNQIGEFGHVVVDPNGLKCECGRRGCLQTLISDTWLIRRAQQAFTMSQVSLLPTLVATPEGITLQTLIDAYLLDDPFVKQMIDYGITALAVSAANLLVARNADEIFVNSQLLQTPELKQSFLQKIKEQMRADFANKRIPVTLLPFEPYRGARGAAALAVLTAFIGNRSYRAIALA